MSEIYASQPASTPRLSDCAFYQTIDIPGLGVQAGQWDLRGNVHNYLGDLDFAGKRVLEIGTANGFVCFEMERRGADVVAFDLAEELTYDAPPHSPEYLLQQHYRDGLRRIRNAWWLAHAALGSRANRIPAALGRFDVGVLANVMQHLQDPIGALMGLAAISDDAVVVTETDWMSSINDELVGMIYFDKDNPYVWYQVKPRLVEAVLRRLGFVDIVRTDHRQLLMGTSEHTVAGAVGVAMTIEVPHYTIVARRQKVSPAPQSPMS
jgi:SAM-dependent methyltransferase